MKKIFTFTLVLLSCLFHVQAQTLQWAKVLNNPQPQGGQVTVEEIKTDASGNTYIIGNFSYTADFDPGTGTQNLTSAGGTSDIFFAKYDASGNYVYAKGMGGSNNNDFGRSLAVDASGNVYVTGYFFSTVDFDPGAGTQNLTSGGDNDIFIAKYDASGNYVYAKGIGSTGGEVSTDIAVDGSGNVVITGYFYGTSDFDPGTGVQNRIATGYDMFLAKYNASGNFVFANNTVGPNAEYGESLVLDASGNIYVTGEFYQTVDFDLGPGTQNLTSAGSTDIFLAKYDASGNYIYAKKVGGTHNDYGVSIAVDASGNTFLTGNFRETADFDPGASTQNLTSNGETDVFIARYDASGNYVYARSFGGTSYDSGESIIIDGSGNAYVTGNFNTTVDFDPATATQNLTSAGGYDIFLAKYNASGNYVYAKGMGGTSNDFGKSIALDGTGNAWIAGTFYGTSDFDPGTGTVNLVNVSTSYENSYVAKYDNSGNYLTAKGLGGYDPVASGDVGKDIAVDAAGNSYVTGVFQGTVDFDPGAGVQDLTSTGSGDIFLAKYNASGNLVYVKKMGSTGYDIGNSIAVDASGNVYITGFFSGTADFDPSAAEQNLTTTGNYDIFFAKYDASGNLIYARGMGGTDYDYSNSLALDGSGNVYITGFFRGTVDLDPGAGTQTFTSAGNQDLFFAKFNSSGNYVYAKAIGGSTGGDISYSIAADASGNAYITGHFIGTVDFDPGAGTQNLTSTSDDAFFAKYDPSGNYVFAKNIDATRSHSIALDGSGNIYIGGYFLNTMDFDPGAGTQNLTSAGAADAFIAKYNSSGNYVYAKNMGGNSDDVANSIAVDGSGNISVTGYFRSTGDYDPGAGTQNITPGGAFDIFIARYDASGNYVYAKAIGATGTSNGESVAVDGAGSVWLAGSLSGTANVDGTTLTATNSSDIFIAKYSTPTSASDYFQTRNSGNWNDVNTWESSVNNSTWVNATLAPDFNANAITIRNTHIVTIAANVTTDQTTVSSGGSLVVSPNVSVIVNDGTGTDITVSTGGSMIIKSTSLGTGSIGNSTTATITGNVTVERYIPAKKAWRLLTSPVTGTTINAAWQGTTWDGTYGNPPSTNQYTLITGQQQGSAATANGNGFDFWSDIANSSASVRKYVGTTTGGSYTPLANTTSPITNEQAYMLFVRGDKSVTSGTELPTVLRPTGVLKTGTQSLTVKGTNTQKFTLLGNPYASPLDFEQVIINAGNNTKIYERFWIWAADQGSFGAYRLVNRTGTNTYEVIPSPYASPGTVTSSAQHIQSSQGFFVEALQTTDATLTVEENDKSNPGTVYSVFRTGNTNERLNINLNHLNADNTATLADGVQAKYGSDFSASIAAEDIQKPNNFNENLAIHRSGSYLIVEGRPLVNSTDTTYLNLWNTTQRSYQFQLKAENFSSSSVSAYLVDKYLNTSTVINLSGDVSSINFAVNGDAASKAIDRFMIVYRTNSTLPVNFTNIKAAQKLTAIQVEWNVATETNTRSYEVEKSTNSQQFVKAATIAATGNTTYNWLDVTPSNGMNYYRVKGISNNGEVKYSAVVRVNMSNGKGAINIYPNPITGNSINLQMTNQERGSYTLRLTNTAGQVVFSGVINHNGGSATQTVQLKTVLPQGVYQLEVTGENGIKEIIKIINNN